MKNQTKKKKTPSIGEARAKLIKRLCLKGRERQHAEAIAASIEAGTVSVECLEDKIARRHANILDPKNWEECNGEAHSNPYIDNCGGCAPNWGKVWKGEQ